MANWLKGIGTVHQVFKSANHNGNRLETNWHLNQFLQNTMRNKGLLKHTHVNVLTKKVRINLLLYYNSQSASQTVLAEKELSKERNSFWFLPLKKCRFGFHVVFLGFEGNAKRKSEWRSDCFKHQMTNWSRDRTSHGKSLIYRCVASILHEYVTVWIYIYIYIYMYIFSVSCVQVNFLW